MRGRGREGREVLRVVNLKKKEKQRGDCERLESIPFAQITE